LPPLPAIASNEPMLSAPRIVSGNVPLLAGKYAKPCRWSSTISRLCVCSDQAICTGRAAVTNPPG